jgi:hypothetical protein
MSGLAAYSAMPSRNGNRSIRETAGHMQHLRVQVRADFRHAEQHRSNCPYVLYLNLVVIRETLTLEYYLRDHEGIQKTTAPRWVHKR